MRRAAGRKDPSPDRLGRDFLYGASREAAAKAALPGSVDLRKISTAPIEDQLTTQACGGFAGAALMSFLYPLMNFSAAQVYYEARRLAGDELRDAGVETRNVLKALQKTGAILNDAWPFRADKIFLKPPPGPTTFQIGSYAMLTGAREMLECLAAGFPFILGFKMPASLENDVTDRLGILQLPDLATDRLIGGHLTLCVGYVTGFKASPLLTRSGLDPSRVDDTMLLIRNSWGSKWSPTYRGHFWMPLSYAANPTTGGDAWTARRVDAPLNPVVDLIAPAAKPAPTKRQLDACFYSLRYALDTETSYGGFVSDEKLRPFTDAAARAVVEAG